MKNSLSTSSQTDRFCQELRNRYEKHQASLRAQFKHEIERIPSSDIVMFIRVKHKYRQLGLHL